MLSNMLVSVVIPCYNAEQYVSCAIESVLEQSYSPVEILLVDDGSTDATKIIAQRYPSVTYLYQQNQGVSKARNFGLSVCKGELVIFLDADDRLTNGRIEEDVRCFLLQPECAYIFGWFKVIDKFGHDKNITSGDHLVEAGYVNVLEGRTLVPPGAVTFRKTILQEVGGFNEEIKMAEDLELYLRISRSYPIFCHNRIVLEYRRHDDNCSSRYGETKSLVSILNLLDRQKGFIQGQHVLDEARKAGTRHWKTLLGPGAVGELVVLAKRGCLANAVSVFGCLLLRCPDVLFATLLTKLKSRLSGTHC